MNEYIYTTVLFTVNFCEHSFHTVSVGFAQIHPNCSITDALYGGWYTYVPVLIVMPYSSVKELTCPSIVIKENYIDHCIATVLLSHGM